MNTEKEDTVKVRLNIEEQMVYEAHISLMHGKMHVWQVKQAPYLIGKMLHQWDEQVNYDTLTLEEITRSTQRADVTNDWQEAKDLLQELLS